MTTPRKTSTPTLVSALRAANAELAGALRALSQAVHAKIQVQGADGNYVLSMDVASADRIIARHASGEPTQEACGGRCGDPLCNLSTEGELMREPAKHPDSERLDWLDARSESVTYDDAPHATAWHIETEPGERIDLRSAIDAARKEASS